METSLNKTLRTIISVAPGRTCLFGDHQDYLGLPVIACAIDRNIKIVAKPNNNHVFKLSMKDIDEERVIDINEIFSSLRPRDYFASSLRVLRKYGCIPDRGYDIAITGDIPINSGTSSSSALLMAWINFLIEAFGINETITSELVAKIGHEAEVLEHGEPGGMMDHYSIGIGNIVYINTSEPFSCTVIGDELDGLITGVSGIPKETIGLLGQVKERALSAIKMVKKAYPDFSLSEARLADVEEYCHLLTPDLFPYFKAAIENHLITQEALGVFKETGLDRKKLGELMNRHHAVLRDLLHITVPRIDRMIDAALSAGAYGAKIVGSGGGGSIVVIAEPGTEDSIVKALLASGAKDAYAVSIDSGIRIVN